MTEYVSIQSSRDVIQHFGIKGMKWGNRKSKEFYTKKYIGKGYNPREARLKADKRIVLNKRLKTGAKIAGGVALAGLAAYGAYKGYGHLKGNWDRVAAEHLAVKQRNEAIRRDWERIKNKGMDKKLDDLHKRGDFVKDLFRQRANEAKKLSSELNNSSKQLVDATNRTRMNAKEANEMLSRIKKRNEDFLKNYK